MYELNLQEIAKKLNKASTVAIYCHTNPDGDTLGCALALRYALINKGKRADVFCEDALPDKYQRLRGGEFVKFPDKTSHDVALAVDCSDIERLGACMKSFLSAREQIAIDHHKSHKRFADITAVDAKAAACAEIVFKLLKQMKAIGNETAELLFGAIITDTGCFSYSSTTEETHAIACELLKYDFNSSDVIYNLHKRTPENVFRLKNRVLSKCKFFSGGKIGMIIFHEEDFLQTGTKSSDTEGIITSVIDVDTVEIAFAISEVNDKNFKVSIRTKEKVDASDCASVFGGGGHKNAAGCRLNGFLEDVVDKLLKAANDRL